MDDDRPARRGRTTGVRLSVPLSVAVIVAVTAIGAITDGLAGGAPGIILYGSLVLGTVLAAMLVEARLVWVLIPVPPLVFPVMAFAAGLIGVKHATVNNTKLAELATRWVADGFIAMVTATLLAVLVTIVRMAGRRT